MNFILSFALGVFFVSSTALAANLSLVSGFYKKSEPDAGFGTSQVSLGARLGFGASQNKQWYGEARFGSVSYSGDGAPDGSTTISIGGGQYYFLRSFGSGVRSYLSWLVGYLNEESELNATSKTKSSGLFYGGNAGFRFDLSSSFFFDLNANLFESALMATDTTEVTAGGTSSKSETKRTELYMDSFGGVDDLTFSVGIEF